MNQKTELLVTNNIDLILKQKNKSQGWLARKIKMERAQLSKIINMVTAYPNILTCYKIARALGRSLEEIWKYHNGSINS